jgi:hypothetical protein
MLADHHKLLYPGCADALKKLGINLELLQWKTMHGLYDKGFCDSSYICNARHIFVSVKYVLVSVKFVCVCVKLLKI